MKKVLMIRRIFVHVFDNAIQEYNPIDSIMDPLNTSESSKNTYLTKFLKTIFFLGHPVVRSEIQEAIVRHKLMVDGSSSSW